MGLAEDVQVSFGIGTQETENMRLVTLVLTKTSILESKNKVYKYFLERSLVFLRELEEKGLIIKTPIDKKRYGKSESDNSFSFKKLENGELKTLEEVFGPINKKSFDDVTHGQGQERKRILTMHSSALLALLFFNSVSDKHPLCISIDEEEYEFTCADFEFENTCLKGLDKNGRKYRPSCIDVKLTDKKRNAVLFLESKFSEYLHNGKQTDISAEYMNQYGNIFNNDNLPDQLTFVEDKGKGTFTLTTKEGKCKHYCQGLKQMMCHFIGAMNYKNDHPEENVMLGTILFEFSFTDKVLNNAFTYRNDYSCLVQKLNSLGKDIKMIDTPFTYQGVYQEAHEHGFVLSDEILKYYGFKE